eukprot:scaffold223_cov408-Prasinococcus_capsulatus_cf.AAC.4
MPGCALPPVRSSSSASIRRTPNDVTSCAEEAGSAPTDQTSKRRAAKRRGQPRPLNSSMRRAARIGRTAPGPSQG